MREGWRQGALSSVWFHRSGYWLYEVRWDGKIQRWQLNAPGNGPCAGFPASPRLEAQKRAERFIRVETAHAI